MLINRDVGPEMEMTKQHQHHSGTESMRNVFVSLHFHDNNVYTYFPLHVGAVSPLAGAEEEESAGAVSQSCPGGRGEAEGGAETVLAPAGLPHYTVDLSRLPQGGVLNSEHNRPTSQCCKRQTEHQAVGLWTV